MALTGKAAQEFHEALKRRNEERVAEALAKAKAEATVRGKEPFDLAKLETMCDTTSEGRLDPEESRRARFECMYYVSWPSLMTMRELANHVTASNW